MTHPAVTVCAGRLNGWEKMQKNQASSRDFEGVIRSTVLIDPKGMTRRRWPKAKAKGHAVDVLTELEKILA